MASLSVIVAEDNRALRDALSTLLPMKDIDATFCIDGGELIEQMQQRFSEFDIAIVDVSLPDACGFDIVVKLRAMGFDRPVILCSGSIENQKRAKETGGDHFLMKPYAPEELLDIIQQLVEQMRDEI